MKKALKGRSVPVEGNMNLVITTLTRRVKKGMLKAKKGPEGWIYWTESPWVDRQKQTKKLKQYKSYKPQTNNIQPFHSDLKIKQQLNQPCKGLIA